MPELQEIHATAASDHGRLMRRASIVTLAGVGFLISLKVIAWFMTDSVSLLSSLVDSLMDMLASLVNFFAIRYALQPPDEEHRFGHGKAEYIAGLVQAVFITVTACIVGIEAVKRLWSPVPVEHGTIGIGVMVVSIIVTFGMVMVQRHAIRHTGSTAVKADMVHYLMDMLSNIAVIAAFALAAGLGWTWADPLIALGIAVYILHGAWEVASTAFQHLMDREFADEERCAIEEVIRNHSRVQGFHALKTRHSGILAFIQFHIDLDKDMRLEDAHAITEEVEIAVRELYPHAEVLIHTDPVTPALALSSAR